MKISDMRLATDYIEKLKTIDCILAGKGKMKISVFGIVDPEPCIFFDKKDPLFHEVRKSLESYAGRIAASLSELGVEA